MTQVVTTAGFAARSGDSGLSPFLFETKKLEAGDVHIKIKFCGVCHSDIHQTRDEWGGSIFPMVPGHEIVGIVEAVGENVTKFKPGDKAGVGCMLDSCLECHMCKKSEEMHCHKGAVMTYNGKHKDGQNTHGGYARDIVVREEFVLKWPEKLPMDVGAPLLCAGITTWQPFKRFDMASPGKKIGVIGIGGLGHVAIMIGNAFGCEVIAISSSDGKKQDAVEKLGAKGFVVSSDREAMEKHKGSFDMIIDSASVVKDLAPYFGLLKAEGIFVPLGVPPEPLSISVGQLLRKKLTVAPSLIGGIKSTQEMLDFWAEHSVHPWIEKIRMDEVNSAYDRMQRSDVRYRFVIDVDTSCPNVANLSESARR